MFQREAKLQLFREAVDTYSELTEQVGELQQAAFIGSFY